MATGGENTDVKTSIENKEKFISEYEILIQDRKLLFGEYVKHKNNVDKAYLAPGE